MNEVNKNNHSFGKEKYATINDEQYNLVFPVGIIIKSKEDPNKSENHKDTEWQRVPDMWIRIKY